MATTKKIWTNVSVAIPDELRISIQEVQGTIEDETGISPSLSSVVRMLVTRGLEVVYAPEDVEEVVVEQPAPRRISVRR